MDLYDKTRGINPFEDAASHWFSWNVGTTISRQGATKIFDQADYTPTPAVKQRKQKFTGRNVTSVTLDEWPDLDDAVLKRIAEKHERKILDAFFGNSPSIDETPEPADPALDNPLYGLV